MTTFEITDKQKHVIMDALDLYYRIHNGQLEAVEWTLDLQNVE